MADNIFKGIRESSGGMNKSFQWYQTQVKKLGNVSTNQLMKETTIDNNVMIGGMYLFAYDPKLKKTLPYYDTFPLVLPFKKVNEGFLGINLHYLPYMVRFKMLAALADLENNNKLDENTRIGLSWRLIESSTRLAPIKACVKQYLTNHIQSRFLKIGYPDWVIASQLPVEKFEKQDKEFVWKETRKKY